MSLSDNFRGSAAIVASGTIVAQVVGLAAYPVLTRIYDPNVFGQYAVAFLGAQLLSLTLVGRYEQTIVLTLTKNSLFAVQWLAAVILMISATATGIAMLLLAPTLDALLGSQLQFLWPIVAVLGALLNVQIQASLLSIRYDKYTAVSTGKIVKAAVSVICQIGLAVLIGPTIWAMVMGELIATAATVAIFIVFLQKQVLEWLQSARNPTRILRSAKAAALRYSDYPKLNLPHVLLNNGAALVLIAIITTFYSNSRAGEFFIMHRISMLPANIISTSLAMVYFRTAVLEYRELGNFRSAFLNTIVPTAIFGACILGTFWFFAVPLFEFALGSQWGQAGQLAAVYAPFTAVHLMASALGNTNLVAGRQKAMLFVGIGQNLIFVGVLYIGASQGKPLDLALGTAVQFVVPFLLAVCCWYWLLARGRT